MTTDHVRDVLMHTLRLQDFIGTFTTARLRSDGEFEVTSDIGSGMRIIAVIQMSDQTVGVFGASRGYPLSAENIRRACCEGLQILRELKVQVHNPQG
jgi:hypothetical protein